MSTTITVRPWPTYSETGKGPIWDLRIESENFNGWVHFSAHQQRFYQNNELFRLRMRNPSGYRQAARLMSDFTAKTLAPREILP